MTTGWIEPVRVDQVVGSGAPGVRVGCRPESGHQLIGDTSAQESALRAELLIEVAVQLIIDRVPIELRLGPSMKPSRDTDIIKMIFLIAVAIASKRRVSAAFSSIRRLQDLLHGCGGNGLVYGEADRGFNSSTHASMTALFAGKRLQWSLNAANDTRNRPWSV
jgi:hypothetical protein